MVPLKKAECVVNKKIYIYIFFFGQINLKKNVDM